MPTRQIALFPLQIVVFPGEQLNLHIFEPRYRQLLKDCEEEGISFGIPAYINGRIQEIGTEVELARVEKRYPKGEMDISTRGLGLFRIKEFHPRYADKLYAGGEITDLDWDEVEDPAQNQTIILYAKELFQLLNITKPIEEDPALFRTFDIAHHLGLRIDQEYELLRTLKAVDRQAYLIQHLETILPVVRETEKLKQKALLNGHFKNLIPPKV